MTLYWDLPYVFEELLSLDRGLRLMVQQNLGDDLDMHLALSSLNAIC